MAIREHLLACDVPEGTESERIDRWLAHHDGSFPRSASSDARTIFTLNGKPVKKSRSVQGGDHVEVRWMEEIFDTIEGRDIPLSVLYEDDHILVIDKQQSLVVHPGAGNHDNTLVHALVFRYGPQFFSSTTSESEDEDDEESTMRPGIVHRLDKDTSGVMVIAKSRAAHAALSQQFAERSTEKYYIAIVHGRMPKRRGHIDTTLIRDPVNRKRFRVGKEGEGKHARTDYLVLRQWNDMAFVRLRLHTGRTHQIRVHLAHLGCPILGDPIYGQRKENPQYAFMMLHALSLRIIHPVSHTSLLCTAPMPERFREVLKQRQGGWLPT